MKSDGYTISAPMGAQHQITKDCAHARAEAAFRQFRAEMARLFAASKPRLARGARKVAA